MKRGLQKTKTRVFGLFTALLVLLMSFVVFAGEARINFTDQGVRVGDIVIVFMKISSDDGTLIGGAELTLIYPEEKLEFISGTDAAGGAGSISILGASLGAGSSIVEYHFAFRALSEGRAEISAAEESVYDNAGEPIALTHIGSSVLTIEGTAGPGETAEPDEAAEAGETAEPVAAGPDETAEMDEAAGIVTEALSDSIDPLTAAGITLSGADKTIILKEPGEQTEFPPGLYEGYALIDGVKIPVWYAGNGEEEYFVVYGVDENGAGDFYRYDAKESEKTLQKYYEGPPASIDDAKEDTGSKVPLYAIFLLALFVAVLSAVCAHLWLDLSRLKKRHHPGRIPKTQQNLP